MGSNLVEHWIMGFETDCLRHRAAGSCQTTLTRTRRKLLCNQVQPDSKPTPYPMGPFLRLPAGIGRDFEYNPGNLQPSILNSTSAPPAKSLLHRRAVLFHNGESLAKQVPLPPQAVILNRFNCCAAVSLFWCDPHQIVKTVSVPNHNEFYSSQLEFPFKTISKLQSAYDTSRVRLSCNTC